MKLTFLVLFCAVTSQAARHPDNTLLRIEEKEWIPHREKSEYVISREKKDGTLSLKINGKEKSLSESQYNTFQSLVYDFILKEQTKKSPKKCTPAVTISLKTPKEEHTVCAGNYRSYFALKSLMPYLISPSR